MTIAAADRLDATDDEMMTAELDGSNHATIQIEDRIAQRRRSGDQRKPFAGRETLVTLHLSGKPAGDLGMCEESVDTQNEPADSKAGSPLTPLFTATAICGGSAVSDITAVAVKPTRFSRSPAAHDIHRRREAPHNLDELGRGRRHTALLVSLEFQELYYVVYSDQGPSIKDAAANRP